MKRFKKILFHANTAISLSCAALFAMVSSCPGVVPEPGNLYYGLARGLFGEVLRPESGAQVIMVRMGPTNEFVMSVSEILPIPQDGPEVNYILRPSLDDGTGPRYANEAGRSNEVIQVYVVINGFRYAVTNTPGCFAYSDPIPRLGGRAAVQKVGVKANDDLDSDCLSDLWERDYFGHPMDGNPSSDDDFDGYSNLTEFLMGTRPDDAGSNPGSGLTLAITALSSSEVRLEWPRYLAIPDVLQWSFGSVGSFSNVPPARLSGLSSNVVSTAGYTNLFFRVRYDLPQ